MEEARGRVLALQIARYFTAEETAGDRVRRITAQLRSAAGPVHIGRDVDQERAGVRTVESADGVAGLSDLHV